MPADETSRPPFDRSDPDRPPLDRSLLQATAPTWVDVEVVDRAASTNALVVEKAQAGAAEGAVVVAEHQTAGRGRLNRTWETPARAALTFSVLLRPRGVPEPAWPWLPLLAGVAVVEAVAAAGGPRCALKWPNDVMHDGLKLGGLLVERVDTPSGLAAVLGVGVNVSTLRPELPVETATSLRLAGMVTVDRTSLLAQMLHAIGRRYFAWTAVGGNPRQELLEEYNRCCSTVGQNVRVHLPAGEVLEGTATSVDPDGALVVTGAFGQAAVSAGDVLHVR